MEINQKVGKWSLLSDHGAHWLCVCECGVRRKVLTYNLREAKTKSCGCTKRAAHRAAMGRMFPAKEALYGAG